MKDPYKKQESKRYTKPIASREAILSYLNENKSGLTFEKLCLGFDKRAMLARLNAMVRDGQITCTKNKYKAIASDVCSGYVIIRNDGYGLVSANARDYILPPRQVLGLAKGDYIKFRTTEKIIKNKTMAVFISVVERAESLLIAQVIGKQVQVYPGQIGGGGILSADTRGIKNKQQVYVRVKQYPSYANQGEVTIHGQLDAVTDMRIWAAILHGLPYEFSEQVIAAAEQLQLPDMTGRKDLTKLPFVTIDGASAKDFDDAVYVDSRAGAGFTLYVAIADVSAYVKPGSEIDSEALIRATSVYFPGQVIPMLPEKLSNDLCSLLPETERAVMVAEMAIDKAGICTRSRIYKAMIKSHARFTYDQVASFVELESKVPDFWQDAFCNMRLLCQALAQKKLKRGALSIARHEQEIIVSEQGEVETVISKPSNIAHEWIELCMLEANETVAIFMQKHNIPGIYREHGLPKPNKLIELKQVLQHFGISEKAGKKTMSQQFQNLITQIQEKQLPEAILVLLLRALPQATYTEKPLPHFGLAYKHYCHFTSPIRRYPDLIVHRQLSAYLVRKSVKINNLSQMAQACSFAERRADQAARDVCKKYLCQYLASKVGTVYSGTIATVLDFGFFVSMPDAGGAEGLVHISGLGDDRFMYYADAQALVGQFSGVSYSIGDSVMVKIISVDIDSGQVNLILLK